jgi:hypothetical protein
MWILDSVRIFAQDLPEDGKQAIARLQPLSGPTVYQVFGYESSVFKLSAVVVGQDDIDDLRAASRDGALHTLSGAWDIYKSVYVSAFSFKPRKGVIWQDLRTDLDCDDPVFDVELELLEE